MNCHEVRQLIGLYVDSELDARNAQMMRAHLEECPECAQLCRAEQDLAAALEARLKPAPKTASLWEEEEAFLLEAFDHQATSTQVAEPVSQTANRWVSWVRDLFWPSPAYYAGLAAVWLALLVLSPHTTTPSKTPAMSRESKLVLLEQRRELRNLLAPPESAAGKADAWPLRPRSESENRQQDAIVTPAVRPGPWQPGSLLG